MTKRTDAVSSATWVDGLRPEADLKIAERVHRSLIPVSERRGNLAIACEFRPMSGVGGDYASVHFQDDQHVVVGVCDVSGHGVGSALLATRVNSFVLSYAPEVHHPCELVDALNAFVFRHFSDVRLYLTFFSLFLDLEKQTLVGAGCGHPPVLLCSEQSGSLRRLESDNPPIGLFENLSQSCSMKQIPYRPGDRLVLYTDGLTESRDPSGEELGVKGLEKIIGECGTLPAEDWTAAITAGVDEFRQGVAATDDQLLLTLSHLKDAPVQP